MRMTSPPMTIAALAEQSDLAVNTVSRFLGGRTWPQPAKLAALERALGFPAGHLDRIARGETHELRVISSDETGTSAGHAGDDLVIGLTPGTLRNRTAAERDRILAAARLAALRELADMDRSQGGPAE